jgi:hypothetical protein
MTGPQKPSDLEHAQDQHFERALHDTLAAQGILKPSLGEL